MQNCGSITYSKIDQVDVLKINNRFASATIALFGGHVLSYIPKIDDRDRLWQSKQAIFDGVTPLRGGIPICWPWFSDRFPQPDDSLPSHGFVRTQNWQLNLAEEVDEGTRVELSPSNTAGPGFAHKTELTLTILVGESLELSLTTRNLDSHPINLTSALHSYFSVNDVSDAQISGISGSFQDKTRDYQTFETPSPYTFSKETDRVHHCLAQSVDIQCGQHTTQVGSSGHDSIVVWNPWQQNSEKMQDMQDDGYRTMLCVETAVTDGIKIEPKESHTLRQSIK